MCWKTAKKAATYLACKQAWHESEYRQGSDAGPHTARMRGAPNRRAVGNCGEVGQAASGQHQWRRGGRWLSVPAEPLATRKQAGDIDDCGRDMTWDFRGRGGEHRQDNRRSIGGRLPSSARLEQASALQVDAADGVWDSKALAAKTFDVCLARAEGGYCCVERCGSEVPVRKRWNSDVLGWSYMAGADWPAKNIARLSRSRHLTNVCGHQKISARGLAAEARAARQHSIVQRLRVARKYPTVTS